MKNLLSLAAVVRSCSKRQAQNVLAGLYAMGICPQMDFRTSVVRGDRCWKTTKRVIVRKEGVFNNKKIGLRNGWTDRHTDVKELA